MGKRFSRIGTSRSFGGISFRRKSSVEYKQSQEDTGMKNLSNQHDGHVSTIATISPNICISGGKDKKIIIQSITDGKVIHIWNEHQQEVLKVCTHKDLVASGSRDLSVKIWDSSKRKSLTTLAGHTLVVTCVDFNSSCDQLCSGSRDNSLRLWDIAQEKSICEKKISRNLVTDLRWQKDENIIVQTSEDKMVKIWDTRILEPVHSFPVQQQIQTCCDVNGSYCLTGNNGFVGRGCEVTLWDLRQKAKIRDYRGHVESVTGCAFVSSSFNSLFFVSCSKDGSICIWQENNPQPCSQKHLDFGPITAIASLNAETLVFGTHDRGLNILRRAINDQIVMLSND